MFFKILYYFFYLLWWIFTSYITIRIFRGIWVFLVSIYEHFILKPFDLSPYLNSWTVVTGASSPLGKAYVEELAKTRGLRKFFLINKDALKLRKFLEELSDRYQAEVQMFVHDFEEETWHTLARELKNLEVGILVNNFDTKPETKGVFMDQERGLGSRLVGDNFSSNIKMLELVLPGMMERNKGIVVNISSILGWRPLPYMSTYPSTKAAINFYSDTLYDECSKSKVKIQCLMPSLLSNHEIPDDPKEYASIIRVHPETYAQSAVKIIGKTRISTGSFFHDLHFMMIKLFGFWVYKKLFMIFWGLNMKKNKLTNKKTKKNRSVVTEL